MLSLPYVLIACLLWTALLFGVALWGEHRGQRLDRVWPYVFALSLGVHCTAWTYYGAASQGMQSGFVMPPTLVGMALVSLFCVPFLARLAALVRRHNSATIADLVVARIGADNGLGVAITSVALVGIVPYIALQLRAVTQGLDALMAGEGGAGGWDVSALFAAAMAVFTILFGARRASATEHNRGIVLALAFESLVKLAALCAVGIYAVKLLRGHSDDVLSRANAIIGALPVPDYLAMVGLGVIAAFTLPHQFHVGVVELRDPVHLKTSRWLFPLYLLLIGLPAMPLALAGVQTFGGSVSPDLFVIALPRAGGNEGLALMAWVGGLSAATGMMILSALTLSIMIGNHWFGMSMVRGGSVREGMSSDLRPRILAYRRIGIIVVFAMSWVYSRAMVGVEALADFGLVSFSALAQLAPAMVLAVWRPTVPPRAIFVGLCAGTLAWLLLVLVPMSGAVRGWPVDSFWNAPAGHRLAVGLSLSLLVNVFAIFGTSGLARARIRITSGGISVPALRQVAARFLDPARIDLMFQGHSRDSELDVGQIVRVERELTAVVGAGMARLLVESARRGTSPPLESMRSAVGEAAQTLRFNQQVLGAALQNMSQGISVVDADLRLVAWNQRYAEMFGFPPGMLCVGQPVSEITQWALQRMPSRQPLQTALARRMDFMRRGTPHLSERVFPDGSTVEIRGNPMPGGGYVATFTDVTAFRHAEEALKRSNESLERRVEDRTARLEQALHDAELANRARTRFLTAIGHDLVQPLHAAQLLSEAMSRHVDSDFLSGFVQQIRGALDSTEGLLSGLLDISRLEAGGWVADVRPFALSEVMAPLTAEFSVLAAANGLEFRSVPSKAWVRSDPQLLRRVLQNLLANAVRYTDDGRVLLGVRRCGMSLRIEVHDSGPGIEPAQQAMIFEEFRRGEKAPGQGLGLGLAIADRIARLLDAPLIVRSAPGTGSTFGIVVPMVDHMHGASASETTQITVGLHGLRVLVVDNDPAALSGMVKILETWGCAVQACTDEAGARRHLMDGSCRLWLLDYHLDDGLTGVELWRRLGTAHGHAPTILLSADAGEDVRAAAHAAGLSLLRKPFKSLGLRWAINNLVPLRGEHP